MEGETAGLAAQQVYKIPRPPDFSTVFKECFTPTTALGVKRINKSVCSTVSYYQQPRTTLTVSVERVRGNLERRRLKIQIMVDRKKTRNSHRLS